MAGFGEAQRAWDEQWASNKLPSGPLASLELQNIPGQVYSDAMNETKRRIIAIYSSFYVLANLDMLPSDLLSEWIGMERGWRHHCDDLDVWLVDRYYRQTPSSAGGPEHIALLDGKAIPARTIRESKWNAPYSVNDWMLAAVDVDVRDIPTIEVLRVPSSIDELTKEQRRRILQNFLEHAGRKAGASSTGRH
jgi:hypothetical protein